jgi:hypothetical protein
MGGVTPHTPGAECVVLFWGGGVSWTWLGSRCCLQGCSWCVCGPVTHLTTVLLSLTPTSCTWQAAARCDKDSVAGMLPFP